MLRGLAMRSLSRLGPDRFAREKPVAAHCDKFQLVVERWRLFDTWVDGFTFQSFVEMLKTTIDSGARRLVVNHNVNSLAQMARDDKFRLLYERADYCFIDGSGVLLLLRLAGCKARFRHRIAVLDWLDPVFGAAEANGWRITHVGADDSVMSKACSRIAASYPELKITLISGFFNMNDERANRETVDRVASSSPDILLVGMGMPRQERWILDNYEDLRGYAIVTVGGAIGYLGGSRRTPPRWLGPVGLEWLYRIMTEPRRLWRRYLVEPIPLIPQVGSLVIDAVGRVLNRLFR